MKPQPSASNTLEDTRQVIRMLMVSGGAYRGDMAICKYPSHIGENLNIDAIPTIAVGNRTIKGSLEKGPHLVDSLDGLS